MINKKQIYTVIISSILAISVTACNSGGAGMQNTTQSSPVIQATTSTGVSSQATTYTASLVTDSKNSAYVIDFSNNTYSVKTFDGSAWVNVGSIVDASIASVSGGKNSASLGVDKQDNLFIAYANGSTTYIKKFNAQADTWDLVTSINGVYYNYTFNFNSKNQGYLSYNNSSTVFVNTINSDNSLTLIKQFGNSLPSGYVGDRNMSYTKIDPSTDSLTAMFTSVSALDGSRTANISKYDAASNSWATVSSFNLSTTINYAYNSTGQILVLDQDAQDGLIKVNIIANGKKKAYKSISATNVWGSSIIAGNNGEFYFFYNTNIIKYSTDSTGAITETLISNSVANSSKAVELLTVDSANNLYASYLSSGNQIVETYN